MSEFLHSFPPGLLLIAASFIVALPWVKGAAKPAIGLLAALGCFALVLMTYSFDIGDKAAAITLIDGHFIGQAFGMEGGIQLTWMQINGPTKIFATVFSLMACVGILFAWNQKSPVEICGALLYSGSAICATFAGDLMTMFIFWELMAVGSSLVVFAGGQANSARAGMRYVAVHFVGGVILMVGIIWYALLEHQGIDGNSVINGFTIYADPLDSPLVTFNNVLAHPAAWLMLVGVLINAGAPPFGSWLPDAYPEASPSGTVFLSAYTTKTAVFVLMMLFAGTSLLIWVGMIMAVYGIVFAILENDMRRILAYSIINQVGFMVCAIGVGSELALCGASAHAFAHIIYKALLLMSAGSVLYMTGKRKCTDLGGLYKTMRWTMIFGTVGALAISAVPFTSGFTSKSMITSATAELAALGGEHATLYIVAWFVLMAASAGVFLHAGIKFPWFVFFQKDSGLRPKDPPKNMFAAMAIFACLCIVFGLPPIFGMKGVSQATIYKILPYTPTMVDHSLSHGQSHHAESVTVTDAQAHETHTVAVIENHGNDGHEATIVGTGNSANSATHGVAQDHAAPRLPYNTWSWHHVISQFSILTASGLAFFVLLDMLKRTLTITLDADWLYRSLFPRFWRGILLPPLQHLGCIHAWVLGRLPGKVTAAVHSQGIEQKLSQDLEVGGSQFQVRLKIKTNRNRQWAVGGAMVVISAMLLIYLIYIVS